MTRLGLPALPKLRPLMPRRRTPRRQQPRPDYSIDLEAQRAKRKRVSIGELTERGAEVLKERIPELGTRDRRSAFTRITDILDVPRNVIANAIARLTGARIPKARRGTFLRKVWFSDLLKELGVPKGPIASVTGFVGDVMIDPLTWATLGATTGTKLAAHLPRVLKPGMRMLRAAARTGKARPQLAAALGMKRTAEVVRGLRQAKKIKDVPRALMGRQGGILARLLVKRAEKGAPEALAFLAQHGERGRSLFRLPGMVRGFPVLGVGAKARKYKAVVQGLTEPEKFARMAQLKGRLGLAGEAARKLGAAREQMRAAAKAKAGERLTKLKATFSGVSGEVTPEAESVIRRRLEASALRSARKKGGGLGKKIAQAQRVGERTRSELARFTTSPTEAPALIAEKVRAAFGPQYTRGAPGVIPKIRALKRQVFGQPVSPVRQQVVGAHQRYGPGAAAAGVRARQQLAQQVQPVIQRLARGSKEAADDLSRQVMALAEAGPELRAVANYAPADPIHGLVAKARRRGGLLGQPEIQKALTGHFRAMEGMRAQATALGVPGGRVKGYAAHVATPEARRYMRMQERMVGAKPGARPGGRLSPLQPSALARARAVKIRMPDGKMRSVLSTNQPRLAELKAAGGKIVAQHEISAAQWNQWAASPKARPVGLLGPERPGVRPFAGRMFAEDLPQAAGSRAAQQERVVAAAQLRDLVGKYGVDVPTEVAARSARYGHLAKVERPPRGNPFSVLEQTGLYDRRYPTPIADMIDSMTKVWERPEVIESLLSSSDRVLSVWKSFQLYHPAYVIRNVFQNFFGGLMAGANPTKVAALWQNPRVGTLRRALVSNDPRRLAGQTIRLAGRDVPLEELYRFGQQRHAVGASRTAMEIPGRFGGVGSAQVATAQARRGWQRVHGAVFRLNTWVEDNQRLATWLHFMDQGMDAERAYMRTLLGMPDLGDLTHWERHGLARLFPWYRWMRRNGALQLFHYLPEKPAYAAMLPRFKNFVEGFRGKDSVPDELRPMWMGEQAAMQVSGGREGGMAFLGQTWFPFEEMQHLLAAPLAPEQSARRLVSAMRPGVKFAAEAATGRSIFKQTPLRPLREVGWKAIPRAIQGRSGTALDAMLGLRPIREWAPGGRVADMPTPGRKIGRAVLGGALQPVEYQRGLVGRYYELNQRQRGLRAQYNRALQVGDQSLADNLLRQWVQVVRQMWAYKLPLPRAVEGMMQSAGVPRPGPP